MQKTILGLGLMMFLVSSVEAALTVRTAEVQSGVAVIQGGNAPRNAPISWEGSQVTQANNGGNFSFQGVVPADCIGRLEDSIAADAIDVPLANCTPTAGAMALVPQTGQTTSFAVGDDGDLQAGVTWPSPRFTDNLNGTVTDHLTRLIWLKNGNCFGPITWFQALEMTNLLASGACSLTDGSVAGDWRLSNVKELQSMMDFEQYLPSLPQGHPFTNLPANDWAYWSSTTYLPSPDHAWSVSPVDGRTWFLPKSFVGATVLTAWPVRGGQ